jgi:hypothetical protein
MFALSNKILFAVTVDPSDRMDDNVNWEFGTGKTSNAINPQY